MSFWTDLQDCQLSSRLWWSHEFSPLSPSQYTLQQWPKWLLCTNTFLVTNKPDSIVKQYLVNHRTHIALNGPLYLPTPLRLKWFHPSKSDTACRFFVQKKIADKNNHILLDCRIPLSPSLCLLDFLFCQKKIGLVHIWFPYLTVCSIWTIRQHFRVTVMFT